MRLCGSLACRREEKWRFWSRGRRLPPGLPSPFAQTCPGNSATPAFLLGDLLRSVWTFCRVSASGRVPPHHHSRPPFRPVEFRDFLGRGRGGFVSESHFQGTPRHALVTVSRSNSVCVPLHLVRTGQKGPGGISPARLQSPNVGQAVREENRWLSHVTWPPLGLREAATGPG